MMELGIIISVWALLLPSQILMTDASLKFASYYGDHMVLQRAPKQSNIWGFADTLGDTVSVTLSGHPPVQSQVYRSVTGVMVWNILLPAIDDTKPYTITASSKDGNVSITDVLFGDVWVCSGQSNMQFTLKMVMNPSQELVDSYSYPDIRVFTASCKTSNTPEVDLLGVEEMWSIPSNATVGGADWSYFSAVCWLYGKYLHDVLQYPIGLIASTWGGTRIEAWSSPSALKQCDGTHENDLQPTNLKGDGAPPPNDASVLWNAMISPFLNLTIYGVIWYQGESNAGSPDSYKCKFAAMIEDWRQKFHAGSNGQTDDMFPFGFVQLAPNRDDKSIIGGFPEIRWHQTYDFGYVPNPALQNVFMAVAVDLPDFHSPYGSIHPRYKQDVAFRLVLSALPVAYNITSKGRYQGPMITAFYIDIGFFTLGLEFDKSQSDLEVRSSDGFEVCCSVNNQSRCDGTDSIWMATPIIKHDEHLVTLSYKGACSNKWVMGLRYAWRESPCALKQCAVYSKENNIPVAPFVELGLIGDGRKIRHVK